MDFFIEILKATGRVFLNPILYWGFLLIWLPSFERTNKERMQFKSEVLANGSEIKNTWIISIISGIIISLFTLGIGVTFTFEMIIILSVIIILLSYTTTYSLLSASYTLGFTYLVLMFMPDNQSANQVLSDLTFTSLAILIGVFLLVEAIMFLRTKREDSFPELVYSKRGKWYGVHHLKKMSIIPVFILMPVGSIIPANSFWPYFSIGGESYSLFLMPFIIGYHHIIRGKLSEKAAKSLGKFIFILAIIVIVFSLNSFQFAGMSIIAVLIAIIGRIYIHYKYYRVDQKRTPYYIEGEEQLRVLGVISGSPAEKLGIQVGDIITKVNNHVVSSVEEFENLLAENDGLCILEIINSNKKFNVLENHSYKGDRLELGILFATEPCKSEDT